MPRPLPALLLAALLGAASAQIRVGNVIISPPGQTPSARTGSAPSAAPSPGVPAGMQEVRGTLTGPAAARLPAGTQTTVTVQDAAPGRAAPLVNVNFRMSRLPNTYMVYFSPGRLGAGKRYVVTAIVRDAQGRTLYRGVADLGPRTGKPMTVNLRLQPAR